MENLLPIIAHTMDFKDKDYDVNLATVMIFLVLECRKQNI